MKKALIRIADALLWLLSLVPLRILYLLSDLTFVLCYCIKPFRYRGKLVRKNLTECFPEKDKKEIRRIERRFYRHFFDLFVESLKSFSATDKWIKRHMEFTNPELIEEYFDKGMSSVMYLGHVGNWEWISSLPLHVKNSDSTNICCQVYHPLENKDMDDLVLKLRGHYGAQSLPMATTLRHLLKYRSEGKNFIVGMIADQVPLWWNIHYWTNFLNKYTPVFSGSETIARKMNLVVFYGDVRKTRRGHYTCTAQLITDDAPATKEFEITEEYWRRLERTVQEDPAIWLWTHNRWKRTWEQYQLWREGKL